MINLFKAIFILIFGILALSCSKIKKTTPQLISLELNDSLFIDIPMPYKFAVSSMQLIEKDDGNEYLLMNDLEYFVIFEINITQKKLSRIIDLSAIENRTYRDFYFHYINDDSIFIFRNPSFDRYFMDNAFALMNTKGELFGDFDLSTSSFKLRENPRPDSAIGIIGGSIHPFSVYEDMIIINIGTYKPQKKILFDEREKMKIPFFGSISSDGNIFKFNALPILINQDLTSFYQDNAMYVSHTVNSEGELFFAHGFELVPGVFDLKNKNLKNALTKGKDSFNLIETPIPISVDQSESKETELNHSTFFRRMYFDEKNKLLLRTAFLPFSNEGLNGREFYEKKTALRVIAAYDKNQNLIGEGVIPSWYPSVFSKPVNSREGLITVKYDTTTCKNCIPLAIFSVESKNVEQAKFKTIKDSLYLNANSLNKSNVTDQNKLKRIFGEAPKTILALQPYGCPACIRSNLLLLEENILLLEEKDIFVIIANHDFHDTKEIINRLKEYKHVRVLELDELNGILPSDVQEPILIRWSGNQNFKYETFTMNNEGLRALNSLP